MCDEIISCQCSIVSTEYGWIALVVSQNGLNRMTIPQRSLHFALRCVDLSNSCVLVSEISGSCSGIENKLRQYFCGDMVAFDVPLDLQGTHFQKIVWELVRLIPWGETRSYTWVAEKVGRPRAARAVGQAMRNNPLPIIIPCHRVIGKNGTMTGYGGSRDVGTKQDLIRLERSTI